MEGSAQTTITMSGNTEEIMKIIEVITNYQSEPRKAKFFFEEGTVTINNSRMKLQRDLILDYLKSSSNQKQDAIIIEMDGPYGDFDNLSEVSFFEELSEALPSITFSGSLVTEETYSFESVECKLVNKKLHVSKYYENYEDLDENYRNVVRNKLPYDKFIKLLGLDPDDFDEFRYDEFIEEATAREHFLFVDYNDFVEYFPSLEISESQYSEILDETARIGLDYDTCRENGECGDLLKYIYDPIERRYYEDPHMAADEIKETPGNVYTGSIQANPFLLTINGVNIRIDIPFEEVKDAGLTDDSLCIHEYEDIRNYAINRPVSIQGSRFFIILRFSARKNENLLSSIKMILDCDNDGKQRWTKSLVFALNTFGRPDKESSSNVSFQGGEIELSWDDDPREGEESEEVIPVINYWGPWEDEDEDDIF